MKSNDENNEIPLIIDPDDSIDYIALKKLLEGDLDRSKNRLLLEIEMMGDKYIGEIDRKNQEKNIEKLKLIPYIIKHTKIKYTEDELLGYDLIDVQNIHNEIKSKNESKFVKFFKLIFKFN